MPREDHGIVAFNRGIISRYALARVDTKRAAFSAQIQDNWLPTTMGSMSLRPGTEYLGSTASNAAARFIGFIKATDDKALIEFTTGAMRVWVDDELVTRPSVTTAVSNGTFDSNITGWTDNDQSGATSVWVTGGYMGLTGNGSNAAIRDQTVTVAGANINIEHALRIVVQRGPVILRVGTSTSDDSYIAETTLGTGTHSLTFTPTGDFNVRFMSRLERQVLIDSCTVESAGVMSLTSPYLAADLDLIRGGPDSQSGDVIFVACEGYQQRRIERRSATSWSIVLYQPEDGPFLAEADNGVTLTPSAIVGNITVTASAPTFRTTHVGALFNLTSNGQQVTQTATAQNTFTNAIRVVGVDAGRVFSISVSGLSATGSTVTLQRSFDSDAGPWTDVVNYTTDQSITYDDTLDNQIAWYRIGVKTGNYAAGTIVMTLTYTAGSITGIVRITARTSSTVVDAEVLRDLGGTAATDFWAEGRWSDYRGWPTAVGFYEGRLAWAGKDFFGASVSDAFGSFDAEDDTDAGPITRTIGPGPVDVINWISPMQRLALGGQGAEHIVRSNSLDEPITPSNCNIKQSSDEGSAAVQAVRVGMRTIYAQRGGSRVDELAIAQDGEYASEDMTVLCPEIGQPRIVRMAVATQPDKRIFCVRSDGVVATLVYDKAEKVLCWVTITSDGASGAIEDVVVLPQDVGDTDDHVYFVVRRTINGATVRYLERLAQDGDCIGGTTNLQADSFVTFTNSPPSATVTGLTHLIGATVVAWYDGVCPADADGDPQTFTVNGSGEITLPEEATTGVVGLAYEAQWQSAKLGQSLTEFKKIDHIGLVLVNTHARGLKMGRDFSDASMMSLPLLYNGAPVDPDYIHTEYDQQADPFMGHYDTDARACLLAQAPRPVTVSAAIIKGEVNA